MKKFIEHSEVIDAKYKITEEDEDGKSIVTEHNINFQRVRLSITKAKRRYNNRWDFSHLPLEPRLTTYELRLIEYAISYSGIKKTPRHNKWIKKVRDELIKRGLPLFEKINFAVLDTIFTGDELKNSGEEILKEIIFDDYMEQYHIVSKMEVDDYRARKWEQERGL